MKFLTLIMIGVWLILIQLPYSSFTQDNYMTGSLVGLTIEDCIHVLNLKTSLKINLELTDKPLSPNYAINVQNLDSNSTYTVVESLLAQGNEYILLQSSNMLNIVPKELENETNYVLNKMVEHISTTNQDLESTFDAITNVPPNLIYLRSSFYEGVLPKDRKKAGDKDMSLSIDNITFREAMNKIAREQGNIYWIAIKASDGSVGVDLHTFQEKDGLWIITQHDPVLKARWDKNLEEQQKQYLEGLAIQKENIARQKAYQERLGKTNTPSGK